MKKSWFIPIALVCMLALLLLPACEEPAPTAPTTPTTPTTPAKPAEPAAPTEPAKPAEPAKPTEPAKPAEPVEPAGPTVLKFSYTMPKGAAIAVGFEWWAEEFPKRTNGRYKVETYPGQSLIKIPASLDAVRAGVAEIVMTSTGTFEKDFPISLCTGLPTLGWPMNSVHNAMLAHQAQWEWINTFPEVGREYKDFKLLWPFQLDSYRLFGNAEVRKAEDFNGLKIGGSGVKMEIVTTNGGASVHVIPPESYMSFDKGIIDVGFFTYAQVENYKLPEVCNYWYNQDFGGGCIIVTMNWDAWNAMSAEDQEIMEQSWYDAVELCTKGSLTDDTIGKQSIKDAGMEITYPTPEEIAAWEAANGPAVDKWVAGAKEVGIEYPMPFLEAWKNIRAKYMKQME